MAALVANVGATPFPRATGPSVIDLGAAQNFADMSPITLTVVLKLRNLDRLNSLLQATYAPGSPQYRHFLTTQEFKDLFAPSAAVISRVRRHFQANGISVVRSCI